MKFLSVLCVLALALCFATSAYAETQSVKVSGDLTMRSFFRNNYTYEGSPDEGASGTRTGLAGADQGWFMTNAEIEVDADLTDNVQTVIRLVNQRDWNVRTKSVTATSTLAVNGNGGYTTNPDEFQIAVDLAYVTLKDFIYSPLTLTIGRQDLWFGKGFVIGVNFQDPTSALTADEYTSITSFDAIKGVLDFDPWTITGFYSNVERNAVQDHDGIGLWGINVGYKFDAYKGEAEGYWFFKNDNQVDHYGPIKSNNNVHTLGLRGSFDPIDVVTIAAEGAYQCGSYVGSKLQVNNRDRAAYALDISGEWRYWTDKFAWKPKLGIEYVLYSGHEDEYSVATAAGTYTGWDGMYRGKFDSAIREFVGKFYGTGRYPARTNVVQTYADASFTNQHQIVFLGSLQPLESLTLKGNYNLFWNMDKYDVSDTKSKGFVGQEIDLTANWDYTEDVSFGVLAAWFVPGKVYDQGKDDVATDLVGTVKVSF
jgi:hypothetical protein